MVGISAIERQEMNTQCDLYSHKKQNSALSYNNVEMSENRGVEKRGEGRFYILHLQVFFYFLFFLPAKTFPSFFLFIYSFDNFFSFPKGNTKLRKEMCVSRPFVSGSE